MSATAESGTLVLADLTGYTAYLSRSEIEHAPTIAGDLLETIVGRLEPPFRIYPRVWKAALAVEGPAWSDAEKNEGQRGHHPQHGKSMKKSF